MTNKVYDFTLAATLGATQRFDVGGAYIKVTSAPGGNIGVKLDSGQEIALLEGQGLRLPEGATFRDVTIRNLQAVANVGKIFIGDAGFEDTRITGIVSITDTGRLRTIADEAFIGTIGIPGTVAEFGHLQIWNPSATKRALVKQLTYSAAVAGAMVVRANTSAFSGVVTGTFNSKRLIGVAGSTLLKSGLNAGSIVAGSQNIRSDYILAAQPVVVIARGDEPIIIEPNTGLFVAHDVANTAMYLSAEITEEAV
jgi:hypothetical protein